MLDRIIIYSFYLLFFLTPLFWTPLNFELFEYNKMILTYGLTAIIVGSWFLKIIIHKALNLNRTPLDIPLLLFLCANILSTIFSIDTHTSIWGYYSRSNGGLLSIASYLLLYWAFVSNFPKEKIKTLFKFAFAAGFIISLWGILEHFGVSPSCVILRGEFNASCWIQDVQSRVFATLGQPNWMAAYLAMLIFPALYFFLEAKKSLELGIWYLVLIAYYLAFTFTYSRGPTLGLISGTVIFLIFQLTIKQALFNKLSFLPLFEIGFIILVVLFNQYIPATLGFLLILLFSLTVIIISFFLLVIKVNLLNNLQKILVLVSLFLSFNLLFGSALSSFRLVSKFAPPPRPSISLPTTPGTQLETGGTESGQIRFIVWRGALDIFKNYPIFGSGVETFAYSYYKFRPVSHNLTSEWDFLYNKAHNEYLNYLATTGILGFGTYMLVIGTFVIWCINRIKNKESRIKLNSYSLIFTASLASYISYLIYNFFLFSVVIIALFFYLFPAIAFVATDSTKPLKFPKTIPYTLNPIPYLYRRPLYTKLAKGFIILSTFYLLYSIFQLWYADTIFAKGSKQSDVGNVGRAYNLLSNAVALNSSEPFYRSELAYSAAQAAASLKDEDASLSASLKEEASFQIAKVLLENPNNVSYFRTAIRTYFELSIFDSLYQAKTFEVLDRAIELAPTDPKLYLNKALILEIQNKKGVVETLKKTLELKPNYPEARQKLEEATKSARLPDGQAK